MVLSQESYFFRNCFEKKSAIKCYETVLCTYELIFVLKETKSVLDAQLFLKNCAAVYKIGPQSY